MHQIVISCSKSGFQLSVKSNQISRLVWFCITTRCDWLTKLAPLSSQPMGIQTKTIPCFHSTRFPTLGAIGQLHIFVSNSDWLVLLFTFVAIGQSNYCGFGYTSQLETAQVISENGFRMVHGTWTFSVAIFVGFGSVDVKMFVMLNVFGITLTVGNIILETTT